MASDWSVVGPGRGRRSKHKDKAHAAASNGHTSGAISIATDALTVDARVAKLTRLQQRLKTSEFGAQVIAAVLGHYAAAPVHAIIAYGIGNFSMHEAPMLQMALLLVLKEALRPIEPVLVSDPVFNELEIAALEPLGLRFSASDDARRRVDARTLFYMPHCEHFMYCNVVASNVDNDSTLMAIFGNSFRGYADRCLVPTTTTEDGVDHVAQASKTAEEQMLWHERFKQHPRECHDELMALEPAFNDSALITFPAR